MNKSSVTQYTFKKDKGLHSELNASFIEELMLTELKASVLKMNDKLPFLSMIISPVIGVAFNMQARKGNIKIEETSASKEGLWQCTLSVNGITEELHTEDDVTYTVIDVPLQEKARLVQSIIFSFNLIINTISACQ